MSAQSGHTNIATDTAQAEGKYWRDGIYLVPTSQIDGLKRWQAIIVLLAPKIQDDDLQAFLLATELVK